MPGKVIRKRRRILIAGEGQGEQALVALLQKLCDQGNRDIHLQFVSSGGGDSLVVIRACVRTKHRQARTRKPPKNCIALLDYDRLHADRRVGRDAIAEAQRHQVHTVFIRPNLEGLLLRLHVNQETRKVPASIAHGELRKLWPEYEKPATAMELEDRFALNDLKRVAQKDDQVSQLLNLIGLE
ncbi:MAG: hypothetical protein OXG29_02255 [Gammaproteobacteria bacterium]|nr:hypothetical protein [Gammaproteobacteria bacterium]